MGVGNSFKICTAVRAVSVQKTPVIHALASQSVTEINLGHHTSYVNIAVVLKVCSEEKKGQRVSLSPLIWREPTNNFTDCYFRMVDPSK